MPAWLFPMHSPEWNGGALNWHRSDGRAAGAAADQPPREAKMPRLVTLLIAFMLALSVPAIADPGAEQTVGEPPVESQWG